MNKHPIALKLLLLAGFPVLGVLLLASLVVSSSREQLERGAALGSVDSLSELSEDVSALVYRLQVERARLSLELAGKAMATADQPLLRGTGAREEARPAALRAFTDTDAALARLRLFMSTRDLSRLPTRLSDGL